MAHIKITWLEDSHECETCGTDWAQGAEVEIDGKVCLEFTPNAHCYDSTSYTEEFILMQILSHLGHTIEEERR